MYIRVTMGSVAGIVTKEIESDSRRITYVTGIRREYVFTRTAPPKAIVLSDYQKEKLRKLRFS